MAPMITDIIKLTMLASILLVQLFMVRLLVMRSRSSSGGQHKVIIDTCAIIDGRLPGLIESNFLDAKLLVPNRVLAELQFMADGHDSRKRKTARDGLDMITALEKREDANLEIVHDTFAKDLPVDEALVRIAVQQKAALYTLDYNLNKVASIQGVKVLNVNELANVLRPPQLPGDIAEVTIVQQGENKRQGVGYLPEGTMVVIENGAQHINQTVRIVVQRMIQTEAGRMIFATLENDSPADSRGHGKKALKLKRR